MLLNFAITSFLIFVDSSSQFAVFHLEFSNSSLLIPTRSVDGDRGAGSARITWSNYLPEDSPRRDTIDVIELLPLDRPSIFLPLQTPRQSGVDIGLGLPFGEHFRTAMLLPSTDQHPIPRLVAGLTDPTQYCFDSSIGMVTISPRSFVLHTFVSLIPSPLRNASAPPLPSARNGRVYFYSLDMTTVFHHVPRFVYTAILNEVTLITGSHDIHNFDDVIPLLPSVEFTIFENMSSRTPAVIFRMYPEDYYVRTDSDRYELRIRPLQLGDAPHFGINFLKQTAMFINYETREVGFCEPV